MKLRLRRKQQTIAVTTGDSWDLLLRGLKDVCIRVNDQQEMQVVGFDEISGTLYGRLFDEANNDWVGAEVTIAAESIRSIHIL